MQAAPGPGSATRYRLRADAGGVRFKQGETELTLSDEGIAYELDGRSGLRRFADLRGVCLQAVSGGQRSRWEALAELTFAAGLPLIVHSSGAWGVDEPERDRSFVAFVEDLHRRLLAGGHGHVAFRRGIPEGRHRFLIGFVLLATVIFGGAALFALSIGLSGRAGFLEVAVPLFVLGGFGAWMWISVARSAPGTYDPRRPPRDVLPE